MNDYPRSKTDERIDMSTVKPDKRFDSQKRRSSYGGKGGWTKSTSFNQKNIKQGGISYLIKGKSNSAGIILGSVVQIGNNDFKDIITISPPEKQNSVPDNTWMDRSIREEMKKKTKWRYRGSLLSMFVLCVYIAVYSAISVRDIYQPTNVLHLTIMLFFSICIVADITRLVSLANEDDDTSSTYIFLLFFGFAQLSISKVSDSHTILFLWIVWWYSNFIQTGNIRSNTHLITSFAIAVVFYVGAKLYQYYNNYYTPKNLQSEIFIGVVGILSLMVVLYFEKSIHRNQLNLVAEEAGVKSLVYINLDLQRQLKVAQISPQEGDISAPLTRATELLISLQKDEKLEQTVRDDIQIILEILNEDKLFEPEFLKITNDTDVTNFLQDVLQARKNTSIWSHVKNKQTIVKQSPKHIIATQIIQLLDDYTNPFFDVIQLDVVSEGHALFYVGSRIFQDQDFQSSLGTNERVFRHFMGKIENGYERGNTYHNSIHAADVMHCLFYLITRDGLRDKLTPEDVFSCVIAAAAHDYMHPGFTNAFLIASKNPLALRYNDQSVLEHFHAASLYEIFQMPEYDILDGLEKDQRLYIREMVISMILATDMAYHFEWLSKFKNKVSTNSLNFDNQNDKKLVLNMALKCSDVNNLTKPPAISRMWTQLIMDEFFKQGDQEKARGMPISMFMDRNSTDIPKCQLGFIDYIVLPLYESWHAYSNAVKGHIDNLLANKAHWKSVAESGNPVPRIQIPVVQVSPLRFLEHHNSKVLRGATQFSRKSTNYYKESEGNDTIATEDRRRSSLFEPILPLSIKRRSTDKRAGFLDVGNHMLLASEHSVVSIKGSSSELSSKSNGNISAPTSTDNPKSRIRPVSASNQSSGTLNVGKVHSTSVMASSSRQLENIESNSSLDIESNM
ncbi:High affinity cAMP-specific 3',5'-cyclic phosphodiesterase 7A [Boothiomyces macroporosus]|uniref:Phosphodiesterase n=1 Tax=Boothiomyces macroporosus TaxID=261099 RepID=A0AAD5Y4Z1_9FUNG|nr:High affinity cAMP-specific 3',5'-cyclic phosphodiesterase 7A [Boothiomyces macroporosus]